MEEYRTRALSLSTRLELVGEMLNPERSYGRVTELAEQYKVSRQWLYELTAQGQAALERKLAPSKPGRKAGSKVLEVDGRFVRKVIMVLPMLRGSIRNVQTGLELLFGANRSVGHIQETLVELGEKTAEYNNEMVPSSAVLGEADEVFCAQQPCLTVVDGESFMALNISAAESRDATTWGLKFLELMERGIEFDDLATDGALAIQAGARDAGLNAPIRHDLFHLMQDGTKISHRLEQAMNQALEDREAAWQALEQATTPKRRRGRPRTAPCSLEEAESALIDSIELYDNWTWLLKSARLALEPITVTGQIASAESARQTIYAAAQLMTELGRADISAFADGLIDKLPKLLSPLIWLEDTLADLRVGLQPEIEAFITHLWLHRLEHKLSVEEIFPPALQPTAKAFWQALSRFHRSSSLAESFHSWLRPFLAIHRSLPEWLSALLQLFWNHHTFSRGKRAGQSPLEIAIDVDVPSLAEAIDSILGSSQPQIA